jgi:xylan 1,4-beta-xylosidase
LLDDSTSWVIHPLYAAGEWKGQGRQGLLNQVRYNENGIPQAEYPINIVFTAPNLPGSGIPWMVPKSDFFTSNKLHPEWSFLGHTPADKWSLSNRPGWLQLLPKSATSANTVIKTDGEHNYSLITRVNFTPSTSTDEAGLWIMRGDEKMSLKLVYSLSAEGDKIIRFNFDSTKYEMKNNTGDTLWLKLVRINHKISGYYSSNGTEWTEAGESFDISKIDSYSDYSSFTGTRHGLYVKGKTEAWFDLFIYRDAHTPILAECPANQYGTSPSAKKDGISSLDNISDNDWALYAGVEFGDGEYRKVPDSLSIIASCNSTDGGIVEVWLDSLDSGNKIAECNVSSTGSWENYKTFTTSMSKAVTGRHDVYLKFKGNSASRMFSLQWLTFF